MRENSKVFARFLHKNINVCTEYSIFSSDLKLANATTVKRRLFKQNTSKDNYRPTIILPNISQDL